MSTTFNRRYSNEIRMTMHRNALKERVATPALPPAMFKTKSQQIEKDSSKNKQGYAVQRHPSFI